MTRARGRHEDPGVDITESSEPLDPATVENLREEHGIKLPDWKPGRDDSWITFSVRPSRSPHGEYVFVELESKPTHGRAIAYFQLSRQDAFDLAAQLSRAAEWLRIEADRGSAEVPA